jgi:hypothetical protein
VRQKCPHPSYWSARRNCPHSQIHHTAKLTTPEFTFQMSTSKTTFQMSTPDLHTILAASLFTPTNLARKSEKPKQLDEKPIN